VLVALKKLAGPWVASSPVLAFVLAVVITAGIALLLHFILEKPAIELGRRLTRSREPRQA
jgi:peptidoglycan/LPS O-acetylase OafA/YrhL